MIPKFRERDVKILFRAWLCPSCLGKVWELKRLEKLPSISAHIFFPRKQCNVCRCCDAQEGGRLQHLCCIRCRLWSQAVRMRQPPPALGVTSLDRKAWRPSFALAFSLLRIGPIIAISLTHPIGFVSPRTCPAEPTMKVDQWSTAAVITYTYRY